MDSFHPKSELIIDLVESYTDLLLRIAFSYMKNKQDAEDMVHDTFIKLMQQDITFDNKEHEKAWLIRVTINHCKNRLKTAWFRKTIPLQEEMDEYQFTPKENDVLEAVSGLPEKYRSVILLYYVAGYSIKEISAALNRKEATVSSQLQRARSQLKIILKEDFDYV